MPIAATIASATSATSRTPSSSSVTIRSSSRRRRRRLSSTTSFSGPRASGPLMAPSKDEEAGRRPAGRMSMSAIVAKGVSKRYGPTLALDSLDLEIERGEVFGLLGPNGSGKTTFIRLLAGYLLPTAGRLEIDGCDSVSDSLAARARIGYVPEAAPVYG